MCSALILSPSTCRIFEEDKARSREITLDDWRARPLNEKVRGRLGMVLRRQL